MHERSGSLSGRPSQLWDGAEGKVGGEGGEVRVFMGSWNAPLGGLTEGKEGNQTWQVEMDQRAMAWANNIGQDVTCY